MTLLCDCFRIPNLKSQIAPKNPESKIPKNPKSPIFGFFRVKSQKNPEILFKYLKNTWRIIFWFSGFFGVGIFFMRWDCSRKSHFCPEYSLWESRKSYFRKNVLIIQNKECITQKFENNFNFYYRYTFTDYSVIWNNILNGEELSVFRVRTF